MRLLFLLAFALLISACQQAEATRETKTQEPAPACTGDCGGSCGGGCMAEAAEPEPAPAALPANATWTAMTVEGMHCGGCARRVKRALAGVEGIAAVEVDLASKTVRVAALPGTDARALAAPRIDELGYHVVD